MISDTGRPSASSRSVAVHPLGARVPARHGPIQAAPDDRVGGGLDDRGQVRQRLPPAIFRFAQPLFGQGAPHHRDQPGQAVLQDEVGGALLDALHRVFLAQLTRHQNQGDLVRLPL